MLFTAHQRDCISRLYADRFRRCIFAVMVTGPSGRSIRISSTLAPERGSSRSSWTWRGTRSRSTSGGRDSSASAWLGRDQVKFEGSLLRLRSPVSRGPSTHILSLSFLSSILCVLPWLSLNVQFTDATKGFFSRCGNDRVPLVVSQYYYTLTRRDYVTFVSRRGEK